MLLEMMVAVGVILLLFEASQTRLASEMEQLKHSDLLLKEKSVRDPLTGLYNRGYFNDVIRRELVSARLAGAGLSVLLADVDRFKQINDRMGHATGDDVLKFVANYLTSCVRESDFVFRWGGDEFLVLLPRTEEADAAQKAEELGHRLPNIPGTERVAPSLSVGWATHKPGDEFPTTLAQADARMYEVKQKGRVKRRYTLGRDLRLAAHRRFGSAGRPPVARRPLAPAALLRPPGQDHAGTRSLTCHQRRLMDRGARGRVSGLLSRR